MYLTRSKTTKKLPIPRKGTKYVVRALKNYKDAVPVLIAIRDMLHLAETAKEVNQMVKSNLLKINGRLVKNFREPLNLFNILEADKLYVLLLNKAGKFILEETKSRDILFKVINKSSAKKSKIQLNLHDGTNLLISPKEKVRVGDSVILEESGKIKKIIPFKNGSECFISKGAYIGYSGEINTIIKGKLTISLEEGKIVRLEKGGIFVK